MKIKQTVGVSCLGFALLAMVGCATTGAAGRGQMESTVYDIHRRVVKLDSTIEQLNQTAALLSERVNQGDENARRMLSLAEENQVKLDKLERDLADLKAQAYRQWGLTGASSGARPLDRQVVIEPPAGSAVTAPAPGPTSMVQESDPIEPAPGPVTSAPVTTTAASAPGDPNAHYQQAQRDYANGQFQKALAAFDEHLRLWPGSESASNALFWKAKCNLKLADYRGAVSDFQQLRRDYGTSTKVPFAMHNQAVAHSSLGEVQQARALLEEVIANYPASPAAEQARLDLQRLNGN